MEQLILVDENDNQIGIEEKLRVHKKGLLHRAFSILIYNSKGEMLLQKRAKDKYHCPGLWSNACCGHPRPKENLIDAAHRRLKEEIGFDCEIKELFILRYKCDFYNGLTENEIGHVFRGVYDGKIIANPKEVDDYKWIDLEQLKRSIERRPFDYSIWFRDILEKIKN